MRYRNSLAVRFAALATALATSAVVTTPREAYADSVGRAQIVGGPSNDFDAVVTTVRIPETTTRTHRVRRRIHRTRRWWRLHPHHRRYRWVTVKRTRTTKPLYFLTSNRHVYRWKQASGGKLVHPQIILGPGPAGSVDECGVHPSGVVYKATATHWVTVYHAEQAAPGESCDVNRAQKHTRWTIRLLSTRNAGKTWRKGGAVITQDKNLLIDPTTGQWNFLCDDTGESHLVVRGRWMYILYDACNEVDSVRHESIARAPLSSLGSPGSWTKWYNGAWSQPGLGGQQSALANLPTGARSVVWNTYTRSFLAASVHIQGGSLYQSSDLIHWTFRSTVFSTGLTGSVWGHRCDPKVGEPAAYGYGSLIGLKGSSSVTGRSFYMYYMEKPAGVCFTDRYEKRMLVTLGG